MFKYLYDASGNVLSQTPEPILLPQITGEPVDQVVASGDIASFSVVLADARKVTYQWKSNGLDIPGMTSDSLVLTNVNPSDQGEYSVVVTNGIGSIASVPAQLLLDVDNDGLPDSWEVANFGDTTSQRGEGDPDKDGVANLDEFLDGTNPNSNLSLRPRLTAFSDAGGSVTAAPTKLSYDLGDTVTLTPSAFPPSVFVGWSGDLSGTSNPVDLTMDANRTVRARFSSVVAIPAGMVASWRGETDASDVIGGHNGTFFAGTVGTTSSVTESGKVGGAFDFDGTVHVQVPDSSDLQPPQITVEAWVFPTLAGPTQAIVARGSSTSDDDTWMLALAGNSPQFISHGGHLLQEGSQIFLNEWSHLAISFDGLVKRLYVNGAQVAWRTEAIPLVYDPAPVPVTIGSDWAIGQSSLPFVGRIDEVSLFNRALTPGEIFDIYEADLVGKDFKQPYFTSVAQLPIAASGTPYSHQYATVLGTAPISFSQLEGMLPPGITLISTGLLSGIPTISGTFDFTVLAMDAAGHTNEQLCVLKVLAVVAIPPGMVASWRGETDASDSIGGHIGAFFSGLTAKPPSITASGKVGGAFDFDGSLHVEIPDSPALKLAELTVEAWVFPTSNGDFRTIIARGSSIGEDDTYYLGLTGNTPQFFSHGSRLLMGPSPVSLNEWTHLAITFDGKFKRLYVNGAQIASQAEADALVYDPADVPVTIGSDWAFGQSSSHFQGRIDELSVYNRALTGEEIFAIYEADFLGKDFDQPYFTSASQLPDAASGIPYSHQCVAILGVVPISFSQAKGILPPGFILTSSGLVSGIPTSTGKFNFTILATDAAGRTNQQLCELQVL
jgi:Concanavalin A-like lectin/glucanases superfamily/Divergent InlB B-repeat domain/Immunoglobulin I-set domain/Putative Ig domain